MRFVAPSLIALALAAGPGIAHADEPSEQETCWLTATSNVRLAGAFLRQTFDLPELTRRLSAYFDVQLRHAFAAGDRFFASFDAAVDPSMTIPDLSVLATEPVKGVENSGYGWREDPIDGGKRFHKGTDYDADRGTPVHAAGDGVVILAGSTDGYGKAVYSAPGGGVVPRYAHLRKIDVKKGDVVLADAVIGEVGSTGRVTGPHLHFEVRLDGRVVCPARYLGQPSTTMCAAAAPGP